MWRTSTGCVNFLNSRFMACGFGHVDILTESQRPPPVLSGHMCLPSTRASERHRFCRPCEGRGPHQRLAGLACSRVAAADGYERVWVAFDCRWPCGRHCRGSHRLLPKRGGLAGSKHEGCGNSGTTTFLHLPVGPQLRQQDGLVADVQSAAWDQAQFSELLPSRPSKFSAS